MIWVSIQGAKILSIDQPIFWQRVIVNKKTSGKDYFWYLNFLQQFLGAWSQLCTIQSLMKLSYCLQIYFVSLKWIMKWMLVNKKWVDLQAITHVLFNREQRSKVLKEALLLFLLLALNQAPKMYQIKQKVCKGTKNVQRNKKCAKEQKMCKGTKNVLL